MPVVRQCRLLSISRSAFYAAPLGESDTNLAIMAEIDRQFLDTPFYAVRQMTWHLHAAGGKPFACGALYRLLQNSTYRGEITHKGEHHPAKHQPIIEAGLWYQVQTKLSPARPDQIKQFDSLTLRPRTTKNHPSSISPEDIVTGRSS